MAARRQPRGEKPDDEIWTWIAVSLTTLVHAGLFSQLAPV